MQGMRILHCSACEVQLFWGWLSTVTVNEIHLDQLVETGTTAGLLQDFKSLVASQRTSSSTFFQLSISPSPIFSFLLAVLQLVLSTTRGKVGGAPRYSKNSCASSGAIFGAKGPTDLEIPHLHGSISRYLPLSRVSCNRTAEITQAQSMSHNCSGPGNRSCSSLGGCP
ncbi:hypothetical protein K474DRAFT_1447608 [Panus rudis PR-1116 ss-1]|nr:hypothetical protein K474DRAFT_1447608 [Panus rudis PR-1116 ss-1]